MIISVMVKGCGIFDDGSVGWLTGLGIFVRVVWFLLLMLVTVFVVLGLLTVFCCLRLVHSFGMLEAGYYVFVVLGLLMVFGFDGLLVFGFDGLLVFGLMINSFLSL